jgi:UPF0271 protein
MGGLLVKPLINLNADLGESFGAWTMGDDAALLRIVGAANIACGFHAGDPVVMRRTVIAARDAGAGIGAHPGFPDLKGFGRRRMDIPLDEIGPLLHYQIGALAAIAIAEGMQVTHVKPHGMLNNMACADRRLADAIAGAVLRLDPALALLAPARSELAAAGYASGLAVIEEVFADRAYLPDGNLVPRSQSGAVLHGAEACLRHVMRMLERQALVATDGSELPARIESICVHGDGADALVTAQALAAGLREAGFELATIPALLGAAAKST